MTTLQELVKKDQSPWLDYISKQIIKDGTLTQLIDSGVTGLTSNPSIFDNAISKTNDYDEDVIALSTKGLNIFEIYDELTVSDIQKAADMFLPLYEKTGKKDGYVSLEINPNLAKNLSETISEGKRLYKKVNRPNLMLKVPATEESLPAVEEFIAEGMNVNVTLIFSLAQYEACAKSYIKGIKNRKAAGKDISHVHSVASVFISRVDSSADKQIKSDELKGQIACANAVLMYEKFKELFNGFEGNAQRPLWASTGTKNPDYSDVKYIEELIVPQTVNTIPESTLRAFLAKGSAETKIMSASQAQEALKKLSNEGISLETICSQLLEDGLVSFNKAFDSLMKNIEEKANALKGA